MIVMLSSACHAVAVRPPLSVPGAMNSELPLKGLPPRNAGCAANVVIGPTGRLVPLPVPGRGRSWLTRSGPGPPPGRRRVAARPLVEPIRIGSRLSAVRRRSDPVSIRSANALTRAEAAFKRFKKKEDERLDGQNAMAEYEAQRAAVREKTARLRALRLARDEAAKREDAAA
jgi:hypothetical protein